MNENSTIKLCSKCGGAIPPEAPQGLCPKCLLLQATIPTETEQPPLLFPPTREQVAAAFPQLEILELVGQGGMGFVFKARQPKLDRIVALKILPESLAADPAFAERFAREGRLLALLNHPNIVTIHDFGQAHSFFYLLMEFVDGVSLRRAMKAGRFTPEQALAVVPKICEALQFAHNEGVLHRDIKPENILLDNKGRVKIADFGIAKLVQREVALAGSGSESPAGLGAKVAGADSSQANLTETGKVLGTPNYMAPEQLEGRQKVDHRADIYSLGVVFYEMLTGELPLGRFQPPSQKVEVDVRLDEVVLHALEKEPSRRYQQASQVKTAVESIASRPSPGQPPFVSSTSSGGRRFWKRFALVTAGCVLAAVILPFLLYQLAHRASPAALQPDFLPAAGTSASVGGANEDAVSKDEAARLKLQQAEVEFERAKARNEAGAITLADYQKAKHARDIAAAEVQGDKLQIAKVKLEAAQAELDLESNLLKVGQTTAAAYEEAKLARDTAALQLKQLELTIVR
jgi:serine/threonine protein kinase